MLQGQDRRGSYYQCPITNKKFHFKTERGEKIAQNRINKFLQSLVTGSGYDDYIKPEHIDEMIRSVQTYGDYDKKKEGQIVRGLLRMKPFFSKHNFSLDNLEGNKLFNKFMDRLKLSKDVDEIIWNNMVDTMTSI